MKLVQLTVAIMFGVLILSDCIPETEAVHPFFLAFVKVGYKLIKRSYYAKCKLRGFVPSGYNCPKFAYGVGLKRGQAQKVAKFYAERVGSPAGCGALDYGHCDIWRFKK